MIISAVIRSKDEAPRLQLSLTAITNHQIDIAPLGSKVKPGAIALEVIVVNDGSSDQTEDVLERFKKTYPIHVVHNQTTKGMPTSSNLGAASATGDILLFLDGDVPVGPGLIKKHAEFHQSKHGIGRGETRHLRCTRYFHDPETGMPRPGCEKKVEQLGSALQSSLVTREQIKTNFSLLDKRSQAGIYPGMAPRKLAETEWEYLSGKDRRHLAWLAAPGQNLSVRRKDFETVNGFDPNITLSEGRELAYRLQLKDLFLHPISEAKSYHLTHRDGWTNPLTNFAWEIAFFKKFPTSEVAIASVVWFAISEDRDLLNANGQNLLEVAELLIKAGTNIHDLRRRCPGLLDLEKEA